MSEVIEFLKACKDMNFAKVKKYLDIGIDINLIYGGYFALKFAVEENKLINEKLYSGSHLLDFLLMQPNIDVNKKDLEGRTAFMWSCMNGSLEVVKKMMKKSETIINDQDYRGMTALMLASSYGRMEIVDLVLKNILIDTSIVNKNGRSAFMFSCQNGWFNTSKKILDESKDRNIEINRRDINGNNALMLAWNFGNCRYNQDVLTMLLQSEELNINENINCIRRMLLSSCRDACDKLTRVLLALPIIDVNIFDCNGHTSLMKACIRQNFSNYEMKRSIIKMLLNQNEINPNMQDIKGFTAMIYAILSFDSQEIMKIFAENITVKVDWNKKNIQGLDVFTIAILNCGGNVNVNTIKCLLDIPNLKPDVPLLMSMNVYEKAFTHCQEYLSKKILFSHISNEFERNFNIEHLYAYAYANDMKNIAFVLFPDQDLAIENCRSIIAEVMKNDESLHLEENVTELVYALRKGMDNFVFVLTSGITQSDILLLCKIFQFHMNGGNTHVKKKRIIKIKQNTHRKKTKCY